MGKNVYFLLSDLFCCLGFSGVVFFAVWAGATRLPKQQKTKTRPRPNSKKKRPPPEEQKKTRDPPFLIDPLRSLIFSKNVRALHVRGRVFFCCLGGGRVVFFAVWAEGVFHFCLFGRPRVLCCCLHGGRVLFCAVWAEACLFFAVWAGTGVHSLTGLPGWALKGLTTKKTKQQKTTRVPGLMRSTLREWYQETKSYPPL